MRIYKVLLFLCFLFPILGNAQGNLTVEIKNILIKEGEIHLGLYNSDAFPEPGKEFIQRRIAVDGDSIVKHTFYNLPEGDYAVAVFHDENNDGECNTNIIGYPKEPFGFSNNVRPRFFKPSFKKTAFPVTRDTTITIHLLR